MSKLMCVIQYLAHRNSISLKLCFKQDHACSIACIAGLNLKTIRASITVEKIKPATHTY